MADKVIGYIGKQPPTPPGGSEPPMELTERVIALEKDASAIKLDVAVIRSNYATKADITSEASSIRSELHKEINAQTWRLITFVCGFGTALVGVTYFIFTHVAK